MADQNDTTDTPTHLNRRKLLAETNGKPSSLIQTPEKLAKSEKNAGEGDSNPKSRRSVLRKAAGTAVALTVGSGAIAGSAAATESDSVEVEELDLHPAVASEVNSVLDMESASQDEIEAFQGACSRVLVCHHTPSGERITLCVSNEGRAAHLRNHPADTPGPCR